MVFIRSNADYSNTKSSLQNFEKKSPLARKDERFISEQDLNASLGLSPVHDKIVREIDLIQQIDGLRKILETNTLPTTNTKPGSVIDIYV